MNLRLYFYLKCWNRHSNKKERCRLGLRKSFHSLSVSYGSFQENRMNRQIKWSPNVTGRIKISVVYISTYSLTTAVTIRSGWLITFCLWVSISIILLLFHWVAKNVLVGSKTKNTPPSLPFHGIFICIYLLNCPAENTEMTFARPLI